MSFMTLQKCVLYIVISLQKCRSFLLFAKASKTSKLTIVRIFLNNKLIIPCSLNVLKTNMRYDRILFFHWNYCYVQHKSRGLNLGYYTSSLAKTNNIILQQSSYETQVKLDRIPYFKYEILGPPHMPLYE